MLELRDITKKFGSRVILNKLNLTIPDGQILAIVGHSGAGKTTLLRCLSGLEKIDSGHFFWNKHEFDPAVPNQKSQIIGVVFQNYELFPNLTVKDNITLAPILVRKEDRKLAEQKAQELLEQLDLIGKDSLYPYQLSGGQQQRVAIARALAMAPRILCYDEPTSALDPALRTKVGEIILQLKRDHGMTQIIVTHDMDFANQVADRIFTVKALDNGESYENED
ncbi:MULTISPECIES: amino acid ABC transporter ATP-binding protein [unclassified Lactobacillus]|uniref:amino acid ABC transporter ATP-binding protein n=1 Tax=unclassified Lactobacillus TaxID=2620435 RepID=UPI00226A181B|nr:MULTISPECIES: amino acid ABC transporter ATP-binding protein [unclassified Lactobacillus]MCX8720165.1 amino acid ABC transporter ATP-binding protein [Lactobacillus sp. B4010]MCX8733334.1 amino acid ABC transporter ATP-binding protein [Lactobacillus sp. B4015]MCX8735455.1 amino acid ABC transporter ATP-binding protein [Lactobacillus sp. B4012]